MRLRRRGSRRSTGRYHTGMRQLHHVRTRIGGVEGGWGNRLKGSVSGEPRCRLCALITLRAVHSDLEFAAPRDADLPDEGRAYVEHVRCESDQEALKPPRNLLWRERRRSEPSERIDRQRRRRSIDGVVSYRRYIPLSPLPSEHPTAYYQATSSGPLRVTR